VTPDRLAIDSPGARWSYAELHRNSEAVAAALTRRGLRPGDRVAALAGNCAEYVALFFGCAHAGLILVPLNWRLAVPELAFQVQDAEPAVVVHDTDRAAAGAGAAGDLPLAGLAGLVDEGRGVPWSGPVRPVADDDPLILMYTSGTTGRPKGALLTHANCFWTNLSLDRISDVVGSDAVLAVLPQFHVGGWNCQPLLAWWKGATVLLEPSFDPRRVLELIATRRVTTMMGVPANYLFLSQQPGFASADLSSLRYVLVGGAPMPETLLKLWQSRGVAILQGYGLTEAAPNVLCLPAEDAVRKVGRAGKPYPHVDVAIAGPARTLLAGAGTGELLVRGPNVFAGYWRNPDATAEALRDGWLHTGDVAERDEDGFYRICDRLKDMYISGGENVYPAEVESVLHEHPAVADAAVVAVPDERWGEVGCAFVVAAEPVSGEDLIAHCRARLARFKVPTSIRFVQTLPRSAMNKLDKNALRSTLTEPRA
jgi:fatty-acyl-CoA synthase